MEPGLDSAEAEAGLWQRLRTAGDPGARARLLEMHLPYAKIVAGVYFGRRYHDEVEFGDYLQLASIGLVEALDRFDPARGVQFRTFAARRMHGAILDGLERMTEKQQQIAAWQRLRNERLQEVKAMAGQGSVAGAVQDPEHLLRFVAEVGIGLALCWMLEGTGMVESAEAGVAPFYRSVAMRQLRGRLLHAVDGLPAHERTVIRSHYLQEVPFDRIADTLGLSKGRISQIHKQALLRLRALVREDADWNASL